MGSNFLKEYRKEYGNQETESTKALAKAVDTTIDFMISTVALVGAPAILLTNMTNAFGGKVGPQAPKLATAIGLAIDASQAIYVPSLAAVALGTAPNPFKASEDTSKGIFLLNVADWVAAGASDIKKLATVVAKTIVNAYGINVQPVG